MKPIHEPPHPVANPAHRSRIHVLQVMGNAIVGGMETYVTRLIEGLPCDRFRTTVLSPYESKLTDHLRASGVEVVILPMPDDPLWSSIQAACALVQARHVDVLHAHLPNAHLLAALAGRLTGRPVLTTVHGRQLCPTDIELHRSAGTHVSVVCQQTYFHALGVGIDPSRLSCVPNGVDGHRFTPREGPSELRARMGIPDGAPLVGFVGRLSPEKGPEVFLRAALLLRALVPAAHFVVFGTGPMKAQADDFIARFSLGGHVHMAGLHDDMPEAYRALDVMVSTSHSEAMPLAIMEAMASGLPVVATRVGGVPDLVEQGQTGWLVAPRDFEGVASQVAHLLNTPGERLRMGAMARQRAVSRFGLQDCLDRTASLLESLAHPPVHAVPPTRPERQAAEGSPANAVGQANGKVHRAAQALEAREVDTRRAT